MNFLCHRHLATRDSGLPLSGRNDGRPLAGLGAMLPDLWRMADRRLRPQAGLAGAAGPGSKERALLWGIEHHLALDHLFHRNLLLTEGEALATRLLKEAEIAGEKVLLFGHVAWEICLDGALLRREGLEKIKAGLRAELALSGPDPLEAALRRHLPELEPEIAREANQRILGLLHQLVWGSWIDGYLSGAGIADRLEGVRRRVRLPPLAVAERRKAAGALELLLEAAEERLGEALALAPILPGEPAKAF